MDFHYKIAFENGTEFQQTISVDEQSLEHKPATDNPPDWCKLDYHQCPNCPLTTADRTHCPIAVSLVPFTEIDDSVSYENVAVEVLINEKRILLSTTLQQAMSSMNGLLFATSGCPITHFFKPMAWYHHPFSTQDETIFRATSVYLIKQYFNAKSGSDIDIDLAGLSKIYEEVHILNRAIAKRIRLAFESDSPANAIVLLDLFTKMLPIAIEESLDEIKPIFMPDDESTP